MAFDLQLLESAVQGANFPRPSGPGAISGHAAGEPFDKHVESLIRQRYPKRTYRQFEALNAVLAANPDAQTYEDRVSLLGPPALQQLLARGKMPMRQWSKDNLFEEKQDDTADILVLASDEPDLSIPTVHLIDVKSRSLDKRGQPQNIISAKKVAEMCADMLDSDSYDSHDITYVGVDWKLDADRLVAGLCNVAELFKVPPDELYINWTAATQIQFHVESIDQGFDGGVEAWCRQYIRHFIESWKAHGTKKTAQFEKRLGKYL